MILLLGGTIDSREIAKELKEKKISFITTTVSSYGKILAEEFSNKVVNETMDKNRLVNFINENSIKIIVDATHPFAKNISENAVNASLECNVKYIRYERPCFPLRSNNSIFFVKDLKEASEKAIEIGHNILLTIGSRGLKDFKKVIDKKNVYARVLPELNSIKACEDALINTGNIIAMQGPFTSEFNKLLINEKKIDLLITKDSGKAGGLSEKITSAEESGINIIIIRRPEIDYPLVFDNTKELADNLMEVVI